MAVILMARDELVAGALVVIGLISILFLQTRCRRRSLRTGPEHSFPRGPPAWPLIGHLPLLRSRPHQVLADLRFKHGYGPLIGLRLGSSLAVVVSSATLAKEFLVTHDKAFANRVPYLFTNNVFYGYNSAVIFSSYNPRWAWLRKIYTVELFTEKRLHDLRHVRHDEVRQLLNRLHDASGGGSDAVDLGLLLSHMSGNATSRLIQSKALTEAYPEMPDLIREIEHEAFPTLGDFIPCLRLLDAIPKQRMQRLHRRIDKVLDSIVTERKQLMARCPSHKLPDDFLQVILNKQVDIKNQEVISHIEIKGVLLDMFGAGIHTSTATIEWAVAELLRQPKCLEKLYEQICEVTKDKEGIVTDEDVQNIPYLECVMKEVLRLHPPIPLLLPRISSTDCEIDGFIFPKGTQAFINVWAIARDPKIWDNPNGFYPERFETKDLDVHGQHYELLPFGGGRRKCPGLRSGISIVQITLANLVKFFDWELPDGQNPSSINMSEKSGLASNKNTPLLAIPKLKNCIHRENQALCLRT